MRHISYISTSLRGKELGLRARKNMALGKAPLFQDYMTLDKSLILSVLTWGYCGD